MRGPVDLAVVGAGPAGSAAALSALMLDPSRSVVLVDKAAFPRDKACGDGVGPEGVDVLVRLGVEHVLDGYPPVRRVRLVGPNGETAIGQAPRDGYVVPRTVFDARLVEAAVARGAELVHERVKTVEARRDGVVINGWLAARTVVGADGANSLVRRAVGLGAQPRDRCALAMRAYAPAPDGVAGGGAGPGGDVGARDGQRARGGRDGGATRRGAPDGGFEVRGDEFFIGFVAEGWPAYVWSFPTGTGLLNVGYGVFDATSASSREALVAPIERRLPGLKIDRDTLRGHLLPLSTHRPTPARGRVLLAGDAASLINPLTGEGIYYALLSGALAGAAAVRAADDPGRAYRGALRRRLGRHLRHTSVGARLFERFLPVELAIDAAGRDPTAFVDLCEFAVGTGLITRDMVTQALRASLRRWLRDRGLLAR